jgi:hypothetical protein
MCDLKRTLDATVSLLVDFSWSELTMATPGPLCTRDAFWYWQDRLAAVFDCVISAGLYLLI